MNPIFKSLLNLLIVAAVSVGLLWGADALTRTVIEKQETEAVRRAFSGMLDAERFVALDTGSGTAVREAYRAEDTDGRILGYAVTASVKGYGGPLEAHVALSSDGSRFLGLRIGSHQETEGYGSRVTEESFYRQFDSLAAPASVNGYTGIDEAGQTAARLKDGSYRAEEETYDNGYRYFVELTVAEGRISAVNWDALKEGGDLTKKQESQNGTYVMTPDGPRWHEQAAAMEEALIASQDPAKLVYDQETGKTDAYAGVSVDVSAFVELSVSALQQAGADAGTMGGTGAVDAVSGATVSSKAVVKAANEAYRFVQSLGEAA